MDAKSIERTYSFYSGFYDLIWNKGFHQSRQQAIQMLSLRRGDKVLDVGVGTGLSLLFYPKDCFVVGIDLCGAMLRKGQKRLSRHRFSHIDLYEMDAMNMAFRDSSFDAVVAAYTISAVPDPSQVMDEMIRVCKTGGKIVFLNHFKNGHPVLSMCEKMISPLTKKMGFRADLDWKTLVWGKPIRLDRRLHVKPLNYWDLVLCTNQKSEASQKGNGYPLRHTEGVAIEKRGQTGKGRVEERDERVHS